MRITSQALEYLHIPFPNPSPPLLQTIPIPKRTLEHKLFLGEGSTVLEGLHQKVPLPDDHFQGGVWDESGATAAAVLLVVVVLD